MRKIWLVKHPLGQYTQDVKALARKNDLVIYDAKFEASLNPAMIERSPPNLTVRGAKRAKKPAVEVAKTD